VVFVAVILAAGLSTRFPGNKLLYTWWGKPVIKHTVENALNSAVDSVVVVTGYMKREVESALSDLNGKLHLVYNPDYGKGMSSSVKAGVRFVAENYKGGVEAVIFTPGDCAWIPSVVYDIMISHHREYKPLILVASYVGRRGHPILFDSKLVSELLNVDEETRGLKGVVEKYKWGLREIDLPFPGIVLDLDTFNDLNRVKLMIKK